MSNNTNKTNTTNKPTKTATNYKKVMKWILIIAFAIVAIGITLSALAWDGLVPTYL